MDFMAILIFVCIGIFLGWKANENFSKHYKLIKKKRDKNGSNN